MINLPDDGSPKSPAGRSRGGVEHLREVPRQVPRLYERQVLVLRRHHPLTRLFVEAVPQAIRLEELTRKSATYKMVATPTDDTRPDVTARPWVASASSKIGS